MLEGLIAQARPAHGVPPSPLRAAAAVVSGGDAASGSSSGGASSSSGSGVTLIIRAVGDEQAQVLAESASGREELQRADVAAFLFDARQPGTCCVGRRGAGQQGAVLRCECRLLQACPALRVPAAAGLPCAASAGCCRPAPRTASPLSSAHPALLPPRARLPTLPAAGSFRAARERMLAVASAAGDALPCLFVQANDADASPQLVRAVPRPAPHPATRRCLALQRARAASAGRLPPAPGSTGVRPQLPTLGPHHPHSTLHPPRQAEEIGEACSQLAVKPPASFGQRPPPQLYRAVVATAQQPELAIPETPSLKVGRGACAGAAVCARPRSRPCVRERSGLQAAALRRRLVSRPEHTSHTLHAPLDASPQAARQYRRMVRKGLLYTGAGTAVVLAGYWGWRYFQTHHQAQGGGGGGGGGGGSSGRQGSIEGAAAGGTH